MRLYMEELINLFAGVMYSYEGPRKNLYLDVANDFAATILTIASINLDAFRNPDIQVALRCLLGRNIEIFDEGEDVNDGIGTLNIAVYPKSNGDK